MKMTLSLILTLMLVSFGAFAEGTTESTPETPVIAFGQANLEGPFPQAQLMGAQRRAEEYGYEFLHYVAENDAQRQLTQMEDALATGVDIVAVWPVDTEAIVSAVEACNEADVPYVALSRMPADLSGITAAAVVDNFGAASMMTDAINRYRIEQNWDTIKVIEVVGDLGDQNAIERTDGFQAEAERLNITTIARVPTEWNPEKAYDGLVAALRANPDVQAIYIPSDFLWPAVKSALETAEMLYSNETDPDRHIFTVAMDGAPEGLDAIRDGYLDFNVNQDPIMLGELVIDLARQIINGDEIIQIMVPVENVPITRENVDDPSLWGNVFAP